MVELEPEFLRKHVAESLREDLAGGDVTTEQTLNQSSIQRGKFWAKEQGVQAGRPVLEVLYDLLPEFIGGDRQVELNWRLEDGSRLTEGTELGEVEGPVEYLLAAERVALNYLQQLSGVATGTNRIVRLVEGRDVKIFDTRKTAPHMRKLQKYAVSVGGGSNHRLDLSGAVMVKDNHKHVAGGLAEALENLNTELEVIVEIHSVDELREVGNFDIDVVMLDNMNPIKVKKILSRIPEGVEVEVSGGIDESNALDYANTGVDRLSLGALTHSFDCLDVSFGLVADD